MTGTRHIWMVLAGCFLGVSCSLVNEDMSQCNTFEVNYSLQLVTNVSTEIRTELPLVVDATIAEALQDYLKDIFRDYAHDVDLSFYDVEGDSLRLHHETHIMDASETSYSLLIPFRKYMHLAVANVADNPGVYLTGDERCHTSSFSLEEADTLNPHKMGVFSARFPMDVKGGQDQEFNVSLYMANCASALVLDTLGSGIKDVRVYLKGLASEFSICDSIYRFNHSAVLRTDQVETHHQSKLCFAGVHFPSREQMVTKTLIDYDDPFVKEDAADALWRMVVYVKLKNNSVTESVLDISNAIRPGEFRIVNAQVLNDGVVATTNAGVSVSVTLDWQGGGNHVIVM